MRFYADDRYDPREAYGEYDAPTADDLVIDDVEVDADTAAMLADLFEPFTGPTDLCF